MHDLAKAISNIQMKSNVRSRRRGLGIAIGLLIAIFIFVSGIKALQIFKMIRSPQIMPAITVTSAPVTEEDWAPRFSAVGTVSAVEGAVVATELGGVVSQIGFENGGEAKKGDMLVKLDTSSEEAQLRTAEADLELARSDLDRARDLAARKVISKAELDAAESKLKQKEGAADNLRAMITKKQVRAPFNGQLGIRQVNVGQMINAGQQVVALTSLDPVYVDFALPQQHLSKLTKGLEVRVRTDALPGREFKGKLTAINSMVDAATRNVPLQATLENPDHALRPGMFAKADVVLPAKQAVLVIPATAISYAPYGDSVFVIEKQKDPKSGKESQVLRQQFIRTAETRGDFVTVTNGLKAGEVVASSGVFKLRNGMEVTVNNELAPKPEVSPTPAQT
jgi:membrane fusion protein (multidrug efflux system)